MHHRSDIYSDPQKEKQNSKTRENSRYKRYKELFEDVPRRFCTRDFIDEEPSREEYPDAEENNGQMRKHSRVYRRYVAGHRFNVKLKNTSPLE